MKKITYPNGVTYNVVSSKEIDKLCKKGELMFNEIGINFIDNKGEYWDVETSKLSDIPIGDKFTDPDNTTYKRISETDFIVVDSIYCDEDREDPYCRVKGDIVPLSYFMYDNDGNKLKEINLTLHDDKLWYVN